MTTVVRAEPWVVTTVEFQTERVDVNAMDAAGVHVSTAGGARTILLEHVLRIERPGAAILPAGRFTLRLVNGDRCAGEPSGTAGEQLRWKDSVLGEIGLPLKSVRAIVSNAPFSTTEIPSETSPEDVVRLSNGDSLRGILTEISDSAVVLQSAGAEPSTVPLDGVRSIELAAAPGGAAAVAGARRFRVDLIGGSSVTADSVAIAEDSVRFEALGRSHAVKVVSVRAIEQVDGPVVWLSQIEPTENVQIPHLGPVLPTRMNASARGTPVSFGPRTYPRAIGTHSYSRLTWAIDGKYKSFRTQYALDGDLPFADVTVRIKLDDLVAHEAVGFKAGKISPVITLELGRSKRLTLEVDYGGNYDVQDRLNWIEPALLK